MKRTTLATAFRLAAQLLLCTIFTQTLAFAAKPIDPATVKERVEKRGVGKGLKVTQLDGTKVTGKIVSIAPDSFVLAPKGTAGPETISFAQVRDIHNSGLSTRAKVGIGVGVGLVVAVVVVAVIFRNAPNINFSGAKF